MTNRLQEISAIEKHFEKSKQKFYIDRNKNIEEINAYAQSIKELDPELIDFEYPELDPEKLFPSLYKEEFVREDYIKERENVLAIVAKFDALQDRLIEKAKTLMSDGNGLPK